MRQRFGYLLSALLFVACGGKILAESAVVDDAGTSSTKVTPAIAPSPAPTVEAPDATPPPAPRESLPDSAQTIRLGSFADGAIVRFNIPAGVLGFELLVRGQPADIVRLEQLTSPAGDYVFDDAKPRGTEVRTGEGVGWASGAVPQAAVYEKSPVEPGAWTAKLGTRASGAGTLSVSLVLQRTLDGAFHGGELDLHVYVPVGLQLSNPGQDTRSRSRTPLRIRRYRRASTRSSTCSSASSASNGSASRFTRFQGAF